LLDPVSRSTPDRARHRSGRITTRLVALSSSAILTVYSIGYLRTRAAAERIEAAERARVVIPAPPIATPPAVHPATAPSPTPSTAAPPPGAVQSAAKPAAREAAKPKKPRPAPANPPAANAPTLTSAAAPTPPAAVVAEPPVTASPPATASPAPAPYKDGTYTGWGTSRHGDIEATVVIENGRIASASISQCLTRYSCSLVAHLQGQVVTRQSPDVDYVSGATQSTNAFYYAVVSALAKAR
jgi:uncharacterized protein with FMN-binding domain